MESRPCAMRLKEFILLGLAKGQQTGNLVGVKGTFALWDGWRSCSRSGGWKLKAEKLGPEIKHALLVERLIPTRNGQNWVETLGKPHMG